MLNEQYKRRKGKSFLSIGLHHIEDIQSEDWTRSKIQLKSVFVHVQELKIERSRVEVFRDQIPLNIKGRKGGAWASWCLLRK